MPPPTTDPFTQMTSLFGFTLPLLVIYILVLSVFLILILFIWMIYASRNKERVLYFETDKVAKMHSLEPNDEGKIKIDDKEFNLRKGNPTYIKGAFGIKPFYICRFDNPIPLVVTGENLRASIIPETLKDLSEQGTLKTLINMGSGRGTWTRETMIMFALVGGFCLMIGLLLGVFGGIG
jgi:hypothetical protein